MEEAARHGESILPFLEAAAKGDVEEIIRSLGIDPGLINTPHPETGNTALIVAAEENRSEVIALLLEHGADVTSCNFANQTAVHVANDCIRAQLLSAVTRTSFPQLSMMQAAWQGDLESVQHLLSTDHDRYVHTKNGQGLTPVMLVLRDVDLFEGLPMGSDYRPVAVLQELLSHYGDTALLDSRGRSAVSYVSDIKSPLRQQLIDALERSSPAAAALDQASCPDTKPTLCDTAPAGPYSSDIQNPGSEEVSSDGISLDRGDDDQDPAADPRAQKDLQEEIAFREMEGVHQTQGRNPSYYSRQWFADPSPEHLTLQSSSKRQPSLPPLHMKTRGDVSKLERLGLGHLVQESYSEPNILESHLNPNPRCDLKYIKGRIWQRLGSAEASRDSKTFPPLSHSPRSPLPARLRPLSETRSRNKEAYRSNTTPSSDNLPNTKVKGFSYEQKLQKTLQNSKDFILSRDLVQVSLDSCVSQRDGCSRTEEDKSRTAEESEMARLHVSCRDVRPLLHANDCAQPRNCIEMTGSLHIEQLHLQDHGESFRNIRPSTMEEVLPGTRKDTKLDMQDRNRTIEETVNIAAATNEDIKTEVEPKDMDSSKTPRRGHVPFVHITFSEQEPDREINHSPSKPLFTKRKMKSGSPLHNANHSFNILAQKENEKTKKNKKTRIMSAPENTKHQGPLSNIKRSHRKNVPLPTLVYSSGPSPSKGSKKASYSAHRSTERSLQRSQTQLSLHSPKRINSPSHIPTLTRSKSSHDFQNINYSDMFIEISSQQSPGPVMYQMFTSTAYVRASNPGRETKSASSSRSCSSKGSRASSSRDSSARSKRSKLKNKKTPSATSHGRRSSSSKLEATEKDQDKTENTVIISGLDWEINAEKQDGGNVECLLEGIVDARQQNFDLSTIKEATIENSISVIQTIRETLKMWRESERSTEEANNPENVDQGLLKGVTDMDCVQEEVKTINHNCDNDNVQDSNIGSPPSQELHATEAHLRSQDDEALGDSLHDENQKEHLVQLENNVDYAYSTSQNISGSPSLAVSEHLTEDLISCLENLMFDEESYGSLVEDDEQNANVSEHQDGGEHTEFSKEQQVDTIPSLMDQKSDPNHSIPPTDHSRLQYYDNSNHWIKGEVLGRGAYGTVYRGLTSQGELIAAKQVTLHDSDPAVAKKEYKKLQEEVDLLKTLKHINIVGYLGTTFEDRMVTIFMEYVPGGSISNILRHFGPLQEVVISRYTNHILQGIAYLHKNRVVHRDIKGNNVMLMPNGVIKLIDFGCAKRLNGLSMNGTRGEMLQSMHGTPYWMAPEVISESGHGEKSDIWSIGCTVFEMGTGKPPLAHMERMAAMFYIGVEKGLMPTLPDHFSRKARDFVNLCLIRDQEQRPSAEQLLQHRFVHWTS
ncbi:mitogen-activated protein kinase kinase kinase 19 [Leptodactylus fuscus]